MAGMTSGRERASTRRVTGHGGRAPGQGPFIRITFEVSARIVQSFAYETYPCPGAHACAKALEVLTLGQSLDVIRSITREVLVRQVGEVLPRHRQIAYGLALLALDDALRDLSEAEKSLGEMDGHP